LATDIRVTGLEKVFHVPVREAGLRNALVSLVRREHREVRAVGGVDLEVDAGEVVGFLGPNGADKTTTLKMLSGLLHPTGGDASVLGFRPWERRAEYLRRITLVMGNRNQLQWDLPVVDSFEMNRAIFQVPRPEYVALRDELVELLEIGDLLTTPVRNLSLGQRMKAEVAGSLLHRPQVLFLDEPTIGLDVPMQKRIRSFVAEYNARYGATVMLTSHYMADVQALCRRVVVIHHGRIVHDGALAELAARFSAHKTLSLTVTDATLDPASLGEVVATDGARVSLRVPREDAQRIAAMLLTAHQVVDLTIEDPPIDDVIDLVFAEQDEAHRAGVEPSA
jgi:ABC-2 type transport system ATP-binding protein